MSGIGHTLLRVASAIIDAGVQPDFGFAIAKKIRLTNICAILAGGAAFPYLFHFLNYSTLLAVATSLSCLGFISTILLNSRRQYSSARWVLIFTANLYLFTTASALGREAGEQMIYFPVMVGSVLVFAFQERSGWWATVALSLFCLFLLEWTDYQLFFIQPSLEEQQIYYQGNLIITSVCTIALALFSFSLYEKQYQQNRRLLQNRRETEAVINYFSTSLFGKNTVDEILWDIAKNCIARLKLVDCVIYLLDDDRQMLVQKAAYGSKNPQGFDIYQPIELSVGQGIVGSVAQTGKAEIVSDTSVDARYIVDDEIRLSEIAVPLVYQEQVLGVIDAEHPEKNFFTEEHLTILEIIAALCSNKIVKARAEEEHQKAEAVRQEAERIKALDEAKSQFFANVTHEFRTPLTLIIGPLEQKLLASLSDEERLTTERMLRHAQRLLRLINQLLDFSKLEQQPLPLLVQPGNLTHFLQSLFASFEWQAHQQQMDYQIHWSPQEITGYFDADKLDKIIYNLLSNAFKFTPPQGKVLVTVAEREKQLEVQVKNTGKGILPDQLPHIFERFYQAKHPEDSPSGGTGIGLALTQELVTIHQGTIEVASVPDQETVFTVRLPIGKASYQQVIGTSVETATSDSPTTEQAERVMPSSSLEEATEHPTLLLIEDHHDLRTYVREQTASDYQVLEAVDGVEGWEAAIAHSPDLIICDWMMPRLDGRTLCERLKTEVRTSHIPVIMLTARADQASRLAGLETGADAYLVKPFNPEELRLRIRKLVEQRTQLRSHFQQELMVSPQAIKVNSTDERFLQQAVALIDIQLSNPDFTVAEWQQELNLSRMHLHRKLKALTGQSATEFIRTYRLKRAAQLLAQRADNVSQIAYQVGFSSLAYFTTSFKSQFGCTPSEYAKSSK